MPLPFDPIEVATVVTISKQKQVTGVQLTMKNGDLRIIEAEALTDEVLHWLQQWGRCRLTDRSNWER